MPLSSICFVCGEVGVCVCVFECWRRKKKTNHQITSNMKWLTENFRRRTSKRVKEQENVFFLRIKNFDFVPLFLIRYSKVFRSLSFRLLLIWCRCNWSWIRYKSAAMQILVCVCIGVHVWVQLRKFTLFNFILLLQICMQSKTLITLSFALVFLSTKTFVV